MTDNNTWAEAIKQLQAAKAREIADRRELVLRYPDIAAKLTERPLRFSRPEAWNGYIPPKLTPDRDGYRLNTSPFRAALVAICAEAEQRERDGGEQTRITGPAA